MVVEREGRLLALQLEAVGQENPHTENGHGPRGSKSGRPRRVIGRPEGQEAPSGEAEHSRVTEPTPAREAGHPQPRSVPRRACQLCVPTLQGRSKTKAERPGAGGRGASFRAG